MPTAYTCLGVHLVFSTKERSGMIESTWRADLHAYLGGTMRGLGASVFAVGGTEDHVHIAANLPAKRATSDIVRELKKAASAWATTRCPGFAWQVGYGAFAFSARERSAVVAYVNRQEEHHRKVSSSDELRGLLAEHGIEWDERYFD